MKTAAQRTEEILAYSGSLDASASLSGSLRSLGHARIVGTVFTDASSVGGSGLVIKQSIDYGINWDYVTACEIFAHTDCGDAFSIEIVGDSVKVEYRNDTTVASNMRMKWYLRPI